MFKIIVLLLFPMFIFGQSLSEDVTELFQKKNYAEAEELVNSFLKRHPNNIKAIELLGDSYAYQEKWDEAILQYETLVESNEFNANYHYKYGGSLGMKALKVNKFSALMMIGDIKNAFLKSAELDPNHIEVRWALVEFYIQLPGIIGGSKKEALNYANELQILSPVDGYLSKGYVYEYTDDPKLAEENYKKAIEVGGSLTCFKKLSDLYEHENEPKKAISVIEQAKDKHQRNALHYQIGKVCADYNIELDKGINFLKIYIKNHSVKDGVPLEWAYYRLAQIFNHKKNKTKALKWINKAIKMHDNFKPALKERDRILNL